EYRYFCLPSTFRFADEESCVSVEDFKIFETRLMYKIFKAGRIPPEDLQKQLLQRLDNQAVMELATLEAIFHVPLVPDRILHKTSTWLRFGSQAALAEFYNSTRNSNPGSGVVPYATLATSLLVQSLVFLKWNFTALFLHFFWTLWTPLRRLWGKLWWRPRA